MWFIPVFMLAELIFLFAYAKLPKAVRFIGCLLLIIMLAVVSYFGMPEQWYLRELLKITIGLVFIYIGFLFEKYNIVSRIPWYVALISIAVCSVLAEINGFTAIGSLEISRVWIFFLNGSIISVAFVALFKFISDKSNRKLKVLDFFGRNTIVVLCTNNLIIEIIRLLEHKLAGDIFVNGGILGTFAFAIILTLIEAVCIRFAEGKLGVLFGKRKVLK